MYISHDSSSHHRHTPDDKADAGLPKSMTRKSSPNGTHSCPRCWLRWWSIDGPYRGWICPREYAKCRRNCAVGSREGMKEE